MFINSRQHELNLKIVYYGSALSGKTTNLQYIHARTNPGMRSELISLKTRADRTLFFDYLQLDLGEIRGLRPRFSLYTVPGQVHYASTRKLVLQGADGIVLVVDSQRNRLPDNLRTWIELQKLVARMGHRVDDFPMVVQFNKQDLPGALPPDTLRGLLGSNGARCFPAVATQGIGVLDTLKAIIGILTSRLQ
jgi:hypothetical protein